MRATAAKKKLIATFPTFPIGITKIPVIHGAKVEDSWPRNGAAGRGGRTPGTGPEAHQARKLGRRSRARAGGIVEARSGHGWRHARDGPGLSGRRPANLAGDGDGDGHHEDGAQGDDDYEGRTVEVGISGCRRFRARSPGADLRE